MNLLQRLEKDTKWNKVFAPVLEWLLDNNVSEMGVVLKEDGGNGKVKVSVEMKGLRLPEDAE